jgi:multiple sugar transport system permease protein
MIARDVTVGSSEAGPREEAALARRAASSGIWQRNRAKYAFILPGIGWVFAIGIFPILYALRLSVFSYHLGGTERFVGLGNYLRAFSDDQFWHALGVTLRFAVVSVCATVTLGLLLALFFNRPIRGMPVFRTILTLPLFSPAVAIGYLALTIVHQDGPVNSVLRLLGRQEPIPWLSDPFWAFVTVSAVDIWQWTPFAFIVLLAGLQAIPDEIYEAAALDTSSSWQVLRHITLPLLLPVIVTVTILRTVESFKMVDIPYAVTGGGPGTATRTYSLYTYLAGMKGFDFGYGTTLSLLLMVLMVGLSALFFLRARQLYE